LWGGAPPPPIPERVLDGIPGFFAWLTFFFAIASAVAFPLTLLLISALLGLYTAVRFLMAGVFNFMGLRQIREWEATDWHQYYKDNRSAQSLEWDDVQHIVIIPNYKEPVAVLRRTLDVLSIQYEARKRITIVMAMEAGEAGCEEKALTLSQEYSSQFRNFFFTVHPRGLPGEMQCKSANEAWAGRWIKKHLINELGQNIDHFCVTTMDADTRWHPLYFYALTALYALDEQRHERFWQAPIRYHGNIWEINPLLRIVNAYATAFELSYLASPFWMAMPMSSYSLSLRLLDSSGYWDGDVIADEWHMYIKAFFAQQGHVSLKEVMLPFIADATIGDGVLGEIRERYLVSLRHAWGAKEIGYTIAKIIDNPQVDFLPSFRLLVRISHDLLLAGAGWVVLTVGSQLPALLHPQISPFRFDLILQDPLAGIQVTLFNILSSPSWLILISASVLVVVLAFVFWYLDVIVRPPRTKPPTWSETIYTLLSFPMMPLITLIVLAIPTIQAQTRLLLGIPLQFRVSKKV
jgi:hypothetical protein